MHVFYWVKINCETKYFKIIYQVTHRINFSENMKINSYSLFFILQDQYKTGILSSEKNKNYPYT